MGMAGGLQPRLLSFLPATIYYLPQDKAADLQGDKVSVRRRQLSPLLRALPDADLPGNSHFGEGSQQFYQVRRLPRRGRERTPVSLCAQASIWLKPPRPQISASGPTNQAPASSNSFPDVLKRTSVVSAQMPGQWLVWPCRPEVPILVLCEAHAPIWIVPYSCLPG